MNPQITYHATARFRQRGISNSAIDYLLKFGDMENAPGGALKIFLTSRRKAQLISGLKKEIEEIERASGVTLVQKDGRILTGYHQKNFKKRGIKK